MKEVVKQERSELVDITKVKGFSDFDPSLLITPRAKIVQAMSEEAKLHPELIGSIVNSLTGDVLAKKDEKLIFTALMFRKNRIMFNSQSGVDCISKDGSEGEGVPGGVCKLCHLSQWTKDVDGNNIQPCTEVLNFISIVEGEPLPFVVSFMKTGYKTGKKLYNYIAQNGFRGFSPYVFKYSLEAKFVDDTKGSYYVPSIEPAGKNSKEDIEYYDAMFDNLNTVEIKMDIADDEATYKDVNPAAENIIDGEKEGYTGKAPF
jgi:hypothetical protein